MKIMSVYFVIRHCVNPIDLSAPSKLYSIAKSTGKKAVRQLTTHESYF